MTTPAFLPPSIRDWQRLWKLSLKSQGVSPHRRGKQRLSITTFTWTIGNSQGHWHRWPSFKIVLCRDTGKRIRTAWSRAYNFNMIQLHVSLIWFVMWKIIISSVFSEASASGRSFEESCEARLTGLDFCQTDTKGDKPLRLRNSSSSNSESLYLISLIWLRQLITHPILRSNLSWQVHQDICMCVIIYTVRY